MFGFKKKKAGPKILEYQNIRLDCVAKDKEQVIDEIGQILVDSGYVGESYIDAMHRRELSFPTNIGNGIALPHGVEEAKKEIRRSGIAVMVFPQGTLWGDELVKLVIGIAGVGEDHLEILSIIADRLAEPGAVDQIAASSQEEIYKVFTGTKMG